MLIVLDTLRADGLSAYGNPRNTSPRIDRLAAEGVLFENTISNAAWTLPGFVGLLSGSYPSARVFQQNRLARSLVEDLATAGYATAAFTEGAYVSKSFGVDRGFDSFWTEPSQGHDFAEGRKDSDGGRIEKTFDAALGWLREHADERFFLLVHSYEVHMPYLRQQYARDLPRGSLAPTYSFSEIRRVHQGEVPIGPTELEYVRALYDGGVTAADTQVGRLLDLLDELKLADDTLVVLTADHGEELGERSPQRLGVHALSLYDTLLRIPLIFRYPARDFAVRRVAAQVRLVDALPTILDLAAIPAPADLDGRSLVPLMMGADRADRPAYSELLNDNSETPLVRHVAMRDGGFKLIVNAPPLSPGASPAELYDVGADPGERENRAVDAVQQKERLAALLRAQREAIDQSGHASFGSGAVPDAERERLRALGYIE